MCFLELLEEFCRDWKKEFESSTVNEPSVFEPLRLYCKGKQTKKMSRIRRGKERRKEVKTEKDKEIENIPLRKHAYSNILKILQPKKGKFSDKTILIVFIFFLKT